MYDARVEALSLAIRSTQSAEDVDTDQIVSRAGKFLAFLEPDPNQQES